MCQSLNGEIVNNNTTVCPLFENDILRLCGKNSVVLIEFSIQGEEFPDELKLSHSSFLFTQPKSPTQILAGLDKEQKQDIDEMIRDLEEENQYVVCLQFLFFLSTFVNFCTLYLPKIAKNSSKISAPQKFLEYKTFP